ncbi:hypothetical protein UlMin_021170 [Ulmus minor]
MLLASTNEGSLANSWILDSICTYHMCPHKEWFCTYQPYDVGTVLMGNDGSCKVVEIGTVNIKMHDGIIRTLDNVQHIPELKKNLISLGTLDSLEVKPMMKKSTKKSLTLLSLVDKDILLEHLRYMKTWSLSLYSLMAKLHLALKKLSNQMILTNGLQPWQKRWNCSGRIRLGNWWNC